MKVSFCLTYYGHDCQTRFKIPIHECWRKTILQRKRAKTGYRVTYLIFLYFINNLTLTNALSVNVQPQADGSAYPRSECPMYLPYAHGIHHHLPAPHDHGKATRLLSPGQYIYCRDNVRAADPRQIGNKEAGADGDDDDIRLTLKRISQDFSDCGLHNDNYTKFFPLKKFRFRA